MTRILAIVGCILPNGGVLAQERTADYPNRNIKVVVSAPAGGGVDSTTRIITEKMRPLLGQPLIIENRPGATGNTAAEAVAASEPDGYTLLTAMPSPLTVNPLMYKKSSFDPKSLQPIAVLTTMPNTLVVRKNFPASTLQEFIAHARANPGKITFASQGIGSTPHLSSELLARRIGTQLIHVPYRGTAQGVNDLIAGHVDMFFLEMAGARELHKNGRAKIIAIGTAERVPELPDTPTLQEGGLTDFLSTTWHAMAAPPQTPQSIVAKLNAAVNGSLNDPETQARLGAIGMRTFGGTPAQMAAHMAAETQRWGDVIRAAGIALD